MGGMRMERAIIENFEQVVHGDPHAALAALRRLSDDDLPLLERLAVLRGRRLGFSWAEIGRLLGRSRQTVRTRFGGPITIGELTWRGRPLDPQSEIHRYYAVLREDLRRERWWDERDDAVPW
jgi:DNA-binding transcriptional MerR regulator